MFSGHYLRQSSRKMSRFNSIFSHFGDVKSDFRHSDLKKTNTTFLIICTVTDVTAEGWQTLNGKAPLVIANGGMSGLYPSSTHIAYEMALSTSLSDLVLWCDVQLTSDGVGICSPDVNLQHSTENVGLSVSDAVIDALAKSAYNNQTAKKALIQSSNSAALKKFKESRSKYELVYEVDENISDVQNETILEITRFADSVIVGKQSVFPRYNGFLLGETNVVEKFQAFKLPVYIQIFSNEYVSQPYDFFSDPYIELNMYYSGVGIDGVITGFLSTAAKYRRNHCLELNLDERPPYMGLFKVGELLNSVSSSMPPAEAPYPVLTEADVAESPLPPAVERRPTYTTNTPGAGAPTETRSNGQPKACLGFHQFFPVLLCLLLF